MLRRLFLSFFIFQLSLSPTEAQDFRLDNFHESTMDMAAATSGVKDLNGQAAALLRLVVRDDKFQFEANLGVLRRDNKTGEVWLFVPQGTRRITISHPVLGVLRSHELPMALKSKTTYDAEVVITNEAYLQLLMQQQTRQPTDTTMTIPLPTTPVVVMQSDPIVSEKPDTTQILVMFTDTVPDVTPMVPNVRPLNDTYRRSHRSSREYFGINLGYSILGVTGYMVSMELGFGHVILEAGATLGNEKTEQIGIYRKNDFNEAYDYSCNRYHASLGILFNPKSVVQLTLQAGGSVATITGKSILQNINNLRNFEKAHAITAFLGLRMALKLGKNLQLFATPQYNIDVTHGDVYDIIKEADSTIKQWGNGPGLTAGLLIKL